MALADAGAGEIVVHARTKTDMYRHPARWEWIARIREGVSVPVIANGDVWSVEHWRRCQATTGCRDVMLGRGAVADPLLARRIAGTHSPEVSPSDWPLVSPLIREFWQRVLIKLEARHAPGRIKHWLGLMSQTYPEAAAIYASLRPLRDAAAITRLIDETVHPTPEPRFPCAAA